jgi:bacterioferritin
MYADYGPKRKILYANWGYAKLHEAIEKRAIHEMKRAEKIIERILYLKGKPSVGKLNPINTRKEFEAQLKSDYEAEKSAVKGYNYSMQACVEGGDNGTRELFKSNLLDEEDGVDRLEAQMDQMKQMGIQNYLSQQK